MPEPSREPGSRAVSRWLLPASVRSYHIAGKQPSAIPLLAGMVRRSPKRRLRRHWSEHPTRVNGRTEDRRNGRISGHGPKESAEAETNRTPTYPLHEDLLAPSAPLRLPPSRTQGLLFIDRLQSTSQQHETPKSMRSSGVRIGEMLILRIWFRQHACGRSRSKKHDSSGPVSAVAHFAQLQRVTIWRPAPFTRRARNAHYKNVTRTPKVATFLSVSLSPLFRPSRTSD